MRSFFCSIVLFLLFFSFLKESRAQETPPEQQIEKSSAPSSESPVNPTETSIPETNEPVEQEPVFETSGEEEKTFQINGYIQNQTGVFISKEKNKYDKMNLPVDHGDKWGKMSMFRNTLLLEADWKPYEEISVHAIFRGVRSLKLEADKDTQVPLPGYNEPGRKIDWVYSNYYNETDLREIYVDIDASKYLSFRIGKQQVTWGETGQYRLLDVVNPTDSTWHFSALESFEDQRIPLWIFKSLLNVPKLDGEFEFVWVPMLDDPEDLVTVPLTLSGAWGLPPSPMQKDQSLAPDKINSKTFLYPDNDIKNSRLGFRWKGAVGDLSYSLVYFYTHVISPPIPEYYLARASAGAQGMDVYLVFPRQHVAGFTLEYPFDYPLGTLFKLEAAIEPDRTYPVYSLGEKKPEVIPDVGAKVWFPKEKKKVLSYAVTLQRPSVLPFINREQSTTFVLQFMQTCILDFDPEEHIIEIPNYDSTESKRNSFKLIGAVFTSYFHGLLTPKLVGIYAVSEGEIISGSLSFILGNHWRAILAANFFIGSDPYKGVGLFRDRDEINATIKYQW
jgi:hypothetical protein